MSNKKANKEQDPSSPLQMKKAVALKYEPGERNAPVVVAKGRGKMAEAILEKAAENGVPIQQDSSLVRGARQIGYRSGSATRAVCTSC